MGAPAAAEGTGDKLANQHRYLLRRHKPVNQLLFGLRSSMHGLRGCLRASKLVLWGLLRRQRGDKLANQHLYLLRRHKPVNQLLFGLRASMHGLRGFCSGGGETCTCTSDSTS